VGDVLKINTAEEVSIKALAELMIRLAGSRSPLTFVPQADVYGPGYEDIRRRVPSIRKMQELLGVEPQVPLAEGLRRTIAWCRQAVRA